LESYGKLLLTSNTLNYLLLIIQVVHPQLHAPLGSKAALTGMDQEQLFDTSEENRGKLFTVVHSRATEDYRRNERFCFT